jgi:hypothetical protein
MVSSAILLKESVGAKCSEIATEGKQEFACIGETAAELPMETASRVRGGRPGTEANGKIWADRATAFFEPIGTHKRKSSGREKQSDEEVCDET